MATTSEDISDIRTLIPDDAPVYGDAENEYLFTDDQITRFHRIGKENVLRAAGLAMIAVGNSEALISKVIVTQDLETDGAKAQKEWREAGRALIAAANSGEVWDGFELINFREGWAVPELTEPPFDGTYPYGY